MGGTRSASRTAVVAFTALAGGFLLVAFVAVLHNNTTSLFLDDHVYSSNRKLELSTKLGNLEYAQWVTPGTVSVPASSSRRPPRAEHYTSSFFDHPKVQAIFEKLYDSPKAKDKMALQVCYGPLDEPNIDVFINEELLDNDIPFKDAYTVFGIDCRDKESSELIAFVAIMDRYGNIENVIGIENYAESVNMLDTNTVLVSAGGDNAFTWNWRTDEIQPLPFTADTHVLHYSHAEGLFYGLGPPDNRDHHDPSVIQVWDPATGQVVWEHPQPVSHINYISFDEDYIYASLRSNEAIVRIGKATHATDMTLGGPEGTEALMDQWGREVRGVGEGKHKFAGTWHHQHKGQMLSARYYSLFDNHVEAVKYDLGDGQQVVLQSFVADGQASRMVVLERDPRARAAREVWSFDTGDQAHIYGGADVTPAGGVLGSSYPQFVDPTDADRRYQQNFWEVTAGGQLAWRVGFRFPDPWAPGDTAHPFSHSLLNQEWDTVDEPPVGWQTYNVERFYAEGPVLARPCLVAEGGAGGRVVLRALPFNSVRTQGPELPGELFAYDEATRTVYATQQFAFQKSWVARPVDLALPPEALGTRALTLGVQNSWGEFRSLPVGRLSELPACAAGQGSAGGPGGRLFYDHP